MCLLAFAWKTHPRWRFVLAGNRDEFHARPSAALAAWTDAPILAGRDLQSGGTWAGIGAASRVAAVTNVRDPRAPQGGPSRGQLPRDYLDGASAAMGYAQALLGRSRDFAPFNLLLADDRHCAYLGNHPLPTWHAVEPGIHALSNGAFDEPWPKTRRLRAAMEGWLHGPGDDFAPLWRALADETLAPDAELPDTGVGPVLERQLSPAFIRGPAYGTRASTLIAIDHHGHGQILERRFGPDGVFLGETTLRNDD